MINSASEQTIKLYSRPECHLCDEAELMLHALGLSEKFEVVDIEPDLKLLQRYSDKVPVLKLPNGKELCWPFDTQSIQANIENCD